MNTTTTQDPTLLPCPTCGYRVKFYPPKQENLLVLYSHVAPSGELCEGDRKLVFPETSRFYAPGAAS